MNLDPDLDEYIIDMQEDIDDENNAKDKNNKDKKRNLHSATTASSDKEDYYKN